MNLFQAARQYTKAGLAVIPLWPDKRKNPHLDSFSCYTQRLPTLEEWNRWAVRWPRANLGLITGYWQNLVALDFDEEETYELWANGPGWGVVGKTWLVRTGRGCHVWFKLASDPGNSRKYTYQGREVLLRARGGYCIVPPSIHWTGKPYKTYHKVPPLEVDSIAPYLEGWEEKRSTQQPTRPAITRSIPAGAVRIEQLITIPEHSLPNARGAYQVCCPFHEDSRPSAWLNIEQQRFGCNACWPGLWWDAVNVLSMLKGLENNQVYKEVMGTSQASGRGRVFPTVGTGDRIQLSSANFIPTGGKL